MFELKIATGNAAFGDAPETRAYELARILRAVADKIEGEAQYLAEGGTGVPRDINGNKVGDWKLTVPEDE